MPDPTDVQITTDEDLGKDKDRFLELSRKSEEEQTDEEKQEVLDLKTKYGKRVQERIGKEISARKLAETRAEEAEEKARQAEERARTLESAQPPPKIIVKQEFVEMGGKKWFTDEALRSQIDAGEITEAEGWSYARKRDKEELKVEIREERKAEEEGQLYTTTFKETAEQVLKRHPEWKENHPDHNPNDELFKLTNEVYLEMCNPKNGLPANPRALSIAEKRAKQILRISDSTIDRSEEFELEPSHAPDRGRREKEITLSEYEKEAAVRMYTRGDAISPKTGRAYTEKEALTKALEAKKARMKKEE